MKSTVFVSLMASAAAFAPVSQQKASTSLSAFQGEVGAMAPLGYFDPLGLCKDGDQANFDRLREVELRHGRISMLAVAGYLTTAAGVRMPGMEDVPGGFAALDVSSFPMEVRGVIPLTLFHVGILEMAMRDVTGKAEFPGDYRNGFIDFGWDSFDEETKIKKRTIELNNGRAAQMGILGIMVHEQMGNLGDVAPFS